MGVDFHQLLTFVEQVATYLEADAADDEGQTLYDDANALLTAAGWPRQE